MKDMTMKNITVNESELPIQITYATKSGRIFEYTLRPAGRKVGLLLNKFVSLCRVMKSRTGKN